MHNGKGNIVKSVSFDSIPAFAPFDNPNPPHRIDISVQSQGKNSEMTVIVNVDQVQVMTYTDKSLNQNFVPSLIGLSNWSGKGWGTSTVTFSNISVTNATP